MMREGDHFVELDDRVSFANRQGPGAVLVSIHYDAVSSQRAARSEDLFTGEPTATVWLHAFNSNSLRQRTKRIWV